MIIFGAYLTADVPHGKANVFVLDGLHVEAYGRYCGHYFAQLELVQDGRLTSGVKTHLKFS